MSHVATVDLEIRDLDALGEAVQRLGGQLARGQQTYRWYGEHVGDYPLPAGFAEEDLGKCEHAVKFPDVEYEIGVVRRRDGRAGYALMWDFIDGCLVQAAGQNCCKVKREYAGVVARKQAMAQGFTVNEQRQADGSIRLRLTK